MSQLYLFLNNYVLGPVLGTLKFLLLLPILTIWFTLASFLVFLKCPFAGLRVIDTIFGRASLVLMGFYWTPRKRMVIRPAIAALSRPSETSCFSLHTEKSTNPSDFVQPGDWIIANLSSYCDLIWYWTIYSGVVMIISDFDEGGLEACPNRFKAFWHYFLHDPTNTSSNSSSVSTVPIVSEYPIIIFPEGVSSNGRGVLKFIANLSSARRNQRIHLTCTKFQSITFNPAFPGQPNSFFLHFWKLCCQLENNLNTRTILPAALFSSNFDLPAAGENPQIFNRTLQQIVAALGHLRPLNLDANDKVSFIKSFKSGKE